MIERKHIKIKEFKNKCGKIVEYRVVGTTGKSKSLEMLDFVFRKENGVFSETDIVKYPYKIIHKELGIENCKFYNLRGSCATKSLRNGVEIGDVANILGHSKIRSNRELLYIYNGRNA